RVLAELPDYSRWLVHRRPDDLSDDLAGLVDGLWTQAHRLTDLLLAPQDEVEPDAIEPADRAVDEGLKKVIDRSDRRPSRAAETGPDVDLALAAAAAAVRPPDDDRLTFRSGIWDRLNDIRNNAKEVANRLASSTTAAGIDEPGADQVKSTGAIAR